MQKPRRTERAEPGRRRTERQIAADKRRREERAREGFVKHGAPRARPRPRDDPDR